jgi:hypothetical protein
MFATMVGLLLGHQGKCCHSGLGEDGCYTLPMSIMAKNPVQVFLASGVQVVLWQQATVGAV